MFAVFYEQYGDPSVLQAGAQPEPHPRASQVRIAVQATAVNPLDCTLRSGHMPERVPAHFPVIPGIEAAGRVDEVGDDVADVAVGDEVFGVGTRTTAEFAVLDHWAPKLTGLDWQQASAIAVAAETAARLLATLHVERGQTLVIDNAAGSVGQAAAQLARLGGVTVVGTASTSNHPHLRELGVLPITYGPGLPARVLAATDLKIDVAIDAAGKGSVAELIDITGSAAKVVTIADADAAALGVQVSSTPGAWDALGRVAALARDGHFTVAIDQGFHFTRAADAHRRVETGHLSGKVVFGG